MVRPTLTGSLGLLALLQPALAATPPAKTECQQNVDDHGGIYISPSSMSEYELSCNTDHYGGDLDHVGSESFLGCSGVCDANPDCLGYAYTPGNCWLKKTFTRKEVSTNVDFALNIQRNLTAAPYMDPPKPAPAKGSCLYNEDHEVEYLGEASIFNYQPPRKYQYKCGLDYPGGDISADAANTFDDCVGYCDNTKDCIAFAWIGGNGPGTCYLKGYITTHEDNPDVDFAFKKMVESTSVVSSTSVVVSTSVSVVAPPPSSSSSVIPETPSEPSAPIATVTETRTKWTLTGSSTSVPVATVTKTHILLTPIDSSSVPVATETKTRTVWTPTDSSSAPVATETKTRTVWTPIVFSSAPVATEIKTRTIWTPTGFESVPVATETKTRIIYTPTGLFSSPVKSASLPAPFSRSQSKIEKSQDGSKTVTSIEIPPPFSVVPIKKTTTSSSARGSKTVTSVEIPPAFSVLPVKKTTTSSSARVVLSLPPFSPKSASKTESADRTKTITSVNSPTGFETILVPVNTTSTSSSGVFVPIVFPPPAGVPNPKGLPVNAPMPTDEAGRPDPLGPTRAADPGPRPGVGFPYFPFFDPLGIFGHGSHAYGKPGRHNGRKHHGHQRHWWNPIGRVVETDRNATSDSNATVASEPFSERLNVSATATSSIACRFGSMPWQTKAPETTSSEEPQSTSEYIYAPSINRPIPTLDATNGFRGGKGFGGSNGPAPAATTVAALPVVALPKPAEPSKAPCHALREKGTKKLRTRLVKGNKDFDGLYLQQWTPSAPRPSSCNNDGGCAKGHPRGSLFLTPNAADAGRFFAQPRDGIVAQWANVTNEYDCHYHGLKLIPHEGKSDLRRNVQGMLDFEENGGTPGMVVEGDKVEVHEDAQFKSFAVCKARQEQHFTPKERENDPLLQYWQKRQKNKLGKRCALVDLEFVE